MKVSILVVDHDLVACKQIKYTLQTELTEVYYASSVQEALQFFSQKPFTVVILNVALSQDEELIGAMSLQTPKPLVVLSCDVSAPRRSEVKPPDGPSMIGHAYDLKTGLQKAREILHDYGPSNAQSRSYILAHGSSLVIDLVHRQAWLDNQPMELTRKNFELLCCLTEHLGEVISKESMFEEIWRDVYDISADGALKFQINHLRQKFRGFGKENMIETVWGVGYRLKGEEESP